MSGLTGDGHGRAGGLMRAATYASVAVASILIAAKFGVWLASDSISMLSTLVDSLLDGLASVVNLLAVRAALEPADKEHRFGHGKAESLSALGQSAFIAGSAVFLTIEAIRRLIDPRTIEHGAEAIGVMVFSIVVTFALVAFQTYVARKTRSTAIAADSLHYKGDLLMNFSVIVALVLSTRFGLFVMDPLFGLGIAAFILHNAWSIAREALNDLMDRELPDEDRARIVEIALARDGVMAIHDLRTRSAGRAAFIQLHIEMDGDLRLDEAHHIAESVENGIAAAFPDSEVIVHQDPFVQSSGIPDRVVAE